MKIFGMCLAKKYLQAIGHSKFSCSYSATKFLWYHTAIKEKVAAMKEKLLQLRTKLLQKNIK